MTKQYYTIGVVGSRRRNTPRDKALVESLFLKRKAAAERAHLGTTVRVVSGGCEKGADRFAEEIARKYGLTIITHYANWNRHQKSAGVIRNGFIADDCDELIACVATDRTGGTEDTVSKVEARDKPVHLV